MAPDFDYRLHGGLVGAHAVACPEVPLSSGFDTIRLTDEPLIEKSVESKHP